MLLLLLLLLLLRPLLLLLPKGKSLRLLLTKQLWRCETKLAAEHYLSHLFSFVSILDTNIDVSFDVSSIFYESRKAVLGCQTKQKRALVRCRLCPLDAVDRPRVLGGNPAGESSRLVWFFQAPKRQIASRECASPLLSW
jgi:hypothetical protein